MNPLALSKYITQVALSLPSSCFAARVANWLLLLSLHGHATVCLDYIDKPLGGRVNSTSFKLANLQQAG